jgi:hypothetical protein
VERSARAPRHVARDVAARARLVERRLSVPRRATRTKRKTRTALAARVRQFGARLSAAFRSGRLCGGAP